jgi:hypothetical protein
VIVLGPGAAKEGGEIVVAGAPPNLFPSGAPSC